jgi:signal peptidase I
MKALAVLRSTFLTIAAVLGAFCILVFGISLALGLKPVIVVSGSMEPTMPTGSLLLAREVSAATVEVGDVVTVQRQNGRGLVTHRVVEVERADKGWSLTLRGDANSVDDPAAYEVTTVGEVVFHAPYLGTIASAFQTRFGIVAITVVTLSIAVAFLWNPTKRVEAEDDREDDDPEVPSRRSPARADSRPPRLTR